MTARDDLARALGRVGGSIPSSTRLRVRINGLSVQVDGVGRLRLPVSSRQARALCSLCEPARYGRGEQTLCDPAVRDTWQVPSDMVHVDWGGDLEKVLDGARRALGLPASRRLTAQFHSMLVYEPGQFFLPHQDSEKDDAMVATLVVSLPSAHTGGELLVHDVGGEQIHRGSRTATSAVVLFADRLHEVRPVRTGHRITLTYNLLVDDDQVTPGVDGAEVLLADLAASLRSHFTTRRPHRYRDEDLDPPRRLAYLLDHQYTERSVGWSRLKGADAERAALLRRASERADCESVLALTEIHEIWDAYDPDWGYRSRRRWRDDDEPGDGDDYELNDLIDTDLRLTHWVRPDHERAEAVSLALDLDEVCSGTATASLTPYESEYQGYMGNYGNTVDRWYRRGAVVVWPRELAFANQAQASPSWALDELLARLRDGDMDRAQAELVTLAPFWDVVTRQAPHQDRFLAKALRVAKVLDDVEAADLLLRSFRIESLRVSHAPHLVRLAGRHGESWVTDLIARWFGSAQQAYFVEGREEWLTTLPDICRALSRAPGIAVRTVDLAWSWLAQTIDDTVAVRQPSYVRDRLGALGTPLAAVLESVAVVGDERLRTAMIAFSRERDEVTPCLVPALRVGVRLPQDVRRAGGFVELATLVAVRLRGRLDLPERAPGDWGMEPLDGCDCELCAGLAAFLRDSGTSRLEWPLATPGRRHVHSRIAMAELPVTHQTRRTGRPYTLVLTKTDELFAAARRARERDRQDLDRLLSDWDIG